jgi:predicted ester cyclase
MTDVKSSSTQQEDNNIALVRLHIEGMWQDGRFDLADQLFHQDFVDHHPTPGLPEGAAGIVKMAQAIKEGFPEHSYEIVHLFATGDLVVDHWIFRGINTGSLFGAAPTGRSIEFSGTDIIRVRDGRIAELWHVEELARLQQQLQ